jgi:hypothetical protein
VETTTATTYAVSGLAPATTYYWQVATGSGTQTASSAVRSLTTVANGTTPCNVTLGAQTTVADVQRVINEVLGFAPPVNDLNSDGVVNVADVQTVINAALGLGCTAK